MWEDSNNNRESYLHLKAMHLGTTTVVTGSNLYRVMLFNFSVLCTCHSPLWGPSHRWLQSPPISLRWQTGITNHKRTQEGEKTMAERIRGSGGDESPLNGGKERKRHWVRFIHSSLKHWVSAGFQLGLTGNKWSLSGRGAISVSFKTQTHYRTNRST